MGFFIAKKMKEINEDLYALFNEAVWFSDLKQAEISYNELMELVIKETKKARKYEDYEDFEKIYNKTNESRFKPTYIFKIISVFNHIYRKYIDI
jgi:hypothetical protein